MSFTKPPVPTFHLFTQHGWADGNRDMALLAHQLVGDGYSFSSPDLGYFLTWLRIEPLIRQVEAIARQTAEAHPQMPWKIVGHSMGGLIWLEVLHRHPDWWSRVHSLVLVASPVGGADLGRIFDPLKLGIGIATDLGTDRRAIAESVAAKIPTLVIAGDIDGGSDGTIPVMSTPIAQAQFICLPNISHAKLKTHPDVVTLIHEFWQNQTVGVVTAADPLIQTLRAIPGMTDAHQRHFSQAKVWHTFADGRTLRTWSNAFGVSHVYVASRQAACVYAGFVGWNHTPELWNQLNLLKQGDR
ncbi:MAG: alpha/beta fold hydrolase [Elainellaceae cyanobacterium]